MRFLKNIIATIKHCLWRARKSKPEDISKKLDKETLERVMKEARFLFSQQAVNVKSLAPDETPGVPQEAKPE